MAPNPTPNPTIDGKVDPKKTILVVGATGRQGGAVVRHLRKAGWKLRALTRNPDSERARWLKASGVEVVRGDLNNRVQLDVALKDIYGLFVVTAYFEKGNDEVAQGKRLIVAAKQANVQHTVLSSIAGADRASGLPHFSTKWVLEQYLRDRGLPSTVLRPSYFMEGLWDKEVFPPPPAAWALLKEVLGAEGRLQMLAADDVGAFAALAFGAPESYAGATLELAGDELSYDLAVDAYREVFGKKPSTYPFALTVLKLRSKELHAEYEWYREPRHTADIPALRQLVPGLRTLHGFFEEKKTAGH